MAFLPVCSPGGELVVKAFLNPPLACYLHSTWTVVLEDRASVCSHLAKHIHVFMLCEVRKREGHAG